LGIEPHEREKPVYVETARWQIRDLNDNYIASHIRKELPGGEDKIVPWEVPLDRKLSEMPLYGAELIKSFEKRSLVVVVEGEKCADALRTLGFQVLGTVTGAATVPSKEVVACLDGFDVYLWADNDELGRTHMNRIAKLLGEPPWMISWKEAFEKGDCADFVEQGGTREQVELLMAIATRPNEVSALPYSLPLRGNGEGQRESEFNDGVDDHALPASERVGKEGTTSPITLRTFPELLAMPIPEHEWFWDQRLIVGGTSILVARPKAGKTVTALNLALHATRGESFLGLSLMKTPVVYLALEGSQTGIMRQLRAIGGTESDANLHFHFGPIITANPLETAEAVRNEILNTSAGLVVVDTMARLFPYVQSLDDFAEVTRALAPMEAVMRQTGAHIVFLMHQGKAQTTNSEISILGSTALYAVPDTAMEIVRDKDGRRIFRTSQRYGEDMESIILGGGTENENFTIIHAGRAEDALKREMLEAIVSALQSSGELNGTELASKVPGKSETYYEVLSAAKAAQIVLVRKDGRSHRHSLNPEWEALGGIEAAL